MRNGVYLWCEIRDLVFEEIFAVRFSRITSVSVISLLLINAASFELFAGVIFTDDFNSGPSPQWGNESGSWTAAGGVYSATTPANWPDARSVLPFVLSDFIVEFDINDIGDGGILLRGSSDGENGVLLITGGYGWGFNNMGPFSGNSLYWHQRVGGVSAPPENPVNNLFTPGVTDARLRVEVSGDTYSVFLSGNPNPITTLTTNFFSSGRVGLYDFSSQTFDNLVLSVPDPVPEPSALLLATTATVLMMLGARRRV